MQFRKLGEPNIGISLLNEAGLPTKDLPGKTILYAGYTAGQVVGIIGLERYGETALLRSLVIRIRERGKGYGKRLVQELSNEARKEGISVLWLLTDSAPSFFTELGFSTRNRIDAPESIRASQEFSSLCPDTAICMSVVLTA